MSPRSMVKCSIVRPGGLPVKLDWLKVRPWAVVEG